MAQVFLTGGSGFIGGALCSQLVEDGHAVRALARSPEAAERIATRHAEPWHGDVLDEDRLAAGMAGCAVAYHVAGVNTHCPDDPAHLMRVNVGGTQAVVRAAARAGVRRVVMTSSAASIGEPHGTVGDEDTAHRGSYLSVYDRSKHEAEMAAFAAGERLGVEVVTLNPSSVQGPGRASGNGKIIIAYLNGKLPAFVDVPVSIVDVADVARGHRLAAERGRPGGRYVLNGATVPSPEALELVAELSGVRERVRLVPPALARAAAAVAEAGARARGRTSSLCRARIRTILHGHRYDGSLATRELGLDYTPLADTFTRTIDWAVAEGLVTRPLPRRRAG
jgi:dihydroflavonol-4-reductase